MLAGRSSQARQPAVDSLTASANEWNFTIRSWQSQDGLPEETVQAFAQTPDGYLWVGTSGGLLRFDGARFHLFAHENTPAFGENSVFCLLAAHDGRLWIGTDGSGLIEWQNGVFHAYPTEKGQTADFVRALAEDRNGLLWVATDDGLFWARNGRLERADKPLGLPVFNVHAVLEDRTGRIWVGGSRLYSLKDGQSREYSLPDNDSRNKVKSFLQTADGVIWVGTVGGLYRLRPGHERFEPVPGVAGTIRALREAPNGELWAGAIGEGIFRIRGDRVTRLKAPSPLVSNTVLSIFADSDRDLWIGTQAGMMRLSRTPVRVLACRRPPTPTSAPLLWIRTDRCGLPQTSLSMCSPAVPSRSISLGWMRPGFATSCAPATDPCGSEPTAAASIVIPPREQGTSPPTRAW